MQLVWRDVRIGDGPPISTALTLAETEVLRALAEDGDVLEIGSAYGYSTVVLAQVARHVTAVDPHTGHGSLYELQANLNAYGVRGKVQIVQQRSQEALPSLAGYDGWVKPAGTEAGRRFDLVWIDGDHTAEVVEHDVGWAIKLLKPGGVVACHDYGEVTCPGVQQALDRLFGHAGNLTDTLAVYRGLYRGLAEAAAPVSADQLDELVATRRSLWAQASGIVDRAGALRRDLTPQEQASYDEMCALLTELDVRIDALRAVRRGQ